MKNLIIFSISDNYSFLLACALSSLLDNSYQLINNTDIYIYSNDIKQENINLLKKFLKN